eukprot:790233-Lingulodinium_polyedra.AAC.1
MQRGYRQALDADRCAYYEGLATEAQEADDRNDAARLYALTRRAGGVKPKVPAGLRAATGEFLAEREQVQQRWLEYFVDLFSGDTAQLDEL